MINLVEIIDQASLTEANELQRVQDLEIEIYAQQTLRVIFNFQLSFFS